jgi:hypothetical protein
MNGLNRPNSAIHIKYYVMLCCPQNSLISEDITYCPTHPLLNWAS